MTQQTETAFDCIIIGYNETPFEQYEALLQSYGTNSEAYRDLKFSFVDLDDKKLTYVDLMNHAYNLAHQHTEGQEALKIFKSGDIPSLAAVYLTHFLRKKGFRATYINLYQHEKKMLAHYLAASPLCVAITTTLYVLNFPVNEIVQYIREYNKEVKIIVGGPLIANHARNYDNDGFAVALQDIHADIYVIEGQGELTLSMIVKSLKENTGLEHIPNLAYYDHGKLRQTAVEPENSSLDETAIDWKVFADQHLGPTIQTRTARSCAFKCAFCNYPTRAGKLTLVRLSTIERELDTLHQLGVKQLVFIDDTFNVPIGRFKEICRMMIKKNYHFNWFSYFRCSNADEEAIDLLAESGCKGVFLGIESGSPIILQNMNKGSTIEKYTKGIQRLHQHKVLLFGSFIVGFPGETEETVKETIDFIQETKLDYYRAQMWYCEPGTPIFSQQDKYRIAGQGFNWTHATMTSSEAMDHIDSLFLTIRESLWLPQWSFDFWIIPYLFGKGLTPEEFKDAMSQARDLLILEFASISKQQKRQLQQGYLQNMVKMASHWNC